MSVAVLLFVVSDTVRALISYAAFHSPKPLSGSAVSLYAELFKLMFASLCFTIEFNQMLMEKFRKQRRMQKTATASSESLKIIVEDAQCLSEDEGTEDKEGRNSSVVIEEIRATDLKDLGSLTRLVSKLAHYAFPAFLYLVNQILFFFAMRVTSPALTQIGVMAKLPLTGLLHHFVIRRQRNRKAWASLGFVCIGLYLFASSPFLYPPPTASNDTTTLYASEDRQKYRLVAPVVGLVISMFSAIAAVYSEILIKDEDDFWMAQVCLYLWGAVFAGLFMPLQGSLDALIPTPKQQQPSASFVAPVTAAARKAFAASSPRPAPFAENRLNVLLVVVTGVNGLLVAMILRVATNLDKIVGTLVSLVAICVAQCLVYPELTPETFTPATTAGCVVIIVSTWFYNRYKNQIPPSAQENKNNTRWTIAPSFMSSGWRSLTNISTRRVSCVVFFSICTYVLVRGLSQYCGLDKLGLSSGNGNKG